MTSDRIVVLDANLLLLLVVGSMDRSLIVKFKRTQSFSMFDYDRLSEIVSRASVLVTTPYLLTEVSNLANALRDDQKEFFTDHFRALITVVDERHTSASILAEHPLFRYGIADVSMLVLSSPRLILTGDRRFASAISASGQDLVLDLKTAIALGDRL